MHITGFLRSGQISIARGTKLSGWMWVDCVRLQLLQPLPREAVADRMHLIDATATRRRREARHLMDDRLGSDGRLAAAKDEKRDHGCQHPTNMASAVDNGVA